MLTSCSISPTSSPAVATSTISIKTDTQSAVTPLPPSSKTGTVLAVTPGAADLNVSVDGDYAAGIVVITQYYTYLGNGLHEKAYELLSTSAQKPHSLEKYLETKQIFFKEVEIISIVPYPVHVAEQGGQLQNPDTEHRKRFTVHIRAWGEGPMSGSVMNGDLQMLFLALVNEGGSWKIDSFGTSPLQ